MFWFAGVQHCVSSKLLNCFVYNVDLLVCSPCLDQTTGHTFCLLIWKYVWMEISLFWFQTGPVCGALVVCPCDFHVRSKANTPWRKNELKLACVGKCVLGDVITAQWHCGAFWFQCGVYLFRVHGVNSAYASQRSVFNNSDCSESLVSNKHGVFA